MIRRAQKVSVESVVVRKIIVLLFALLGILAPGAQEIDLRARIAVLEVANPGSEKRLEPACQAVRDTVRLTLRLMRKYAVIEQADLYPEADPRAIRGWCVEQRVDQAVYGEVQARTAGGYSVALRVYDRLQNKVTIEREERAQGILDVFEATDAAVQALLEALSGEHIAFGSISLERRGEEGGYAVLIDGVEAGKSVRSVRNVLIGSRTVVVKQQRLTGLVEVARTAVAVPEDGTVAVRFEVPYLTVDEKAQLAGYDARIDGRLYDADAWAEVDRDLWGAIEFLRGSPDLPYLTPLWQEYQVKAGLHGVFGAELKMQPDNPGVEPFVMLSEIEWRVDEYTQREKVRAEAREAMRRVFALLRASAIGELAAGRWKAAASRYELMQSLIDGLYVEAPSSFPEERDFVASAYKDFTSGPALFTTEPMKRKVKAWFGPQLDAATAVLADFGTVSGRELVVMTEPPGMSVTVNGREAGTAPVRVRSLQGGTARVMAVDPWFGVVEREVPLRGARTLLAVTTDEGGGADAVRLEARPAEQTKVNEWTLSWRPVAGAVRYDVQVLSESSGPQSVIENLAGLKNVGYVLKKQLTGGSRYTWRVRPVSANSRKGPWSEEAFFKGQLIWRRYEDSPAGEGRTDGVSFRGAMWLFSGQKSQDGKQVIWRVDANGKWEKINDAADYKFRSGFGLCVFKDQMWVIGGRRGQKRLPPSELLNDVWSSSNGRDWVRVVEQAPFSGRNEPVCLVFRDRLWVIGGWGYDESGKDLHFGDAWSSLDGKNWTKESAEVPIPYGGVSGVVFHDKMWLFLDGWLASSSDGVVWSLEQAIPSFSGSGSGGRLVTYRGQLWAFQGQPSMDVTPQQAFERGVFTSTDGVKWTHPLLGSDVFMLRNVVASYLECDGRLWLLGGEAEQQGGWVGYSDVWAGTLLE